MSRLASTSRRGVKLCAARPLLFAMSLKNVYPAFPLTKRGQPSPLKLSPDRSKLLYSRDKIVIIRDVEAAGDKPIQVQLYSEHGYKVTGVEMATSGCYVASGDASGVVRIWACDNPEQILKLETPVLGGPILDIAWSADSQRVVAAGEGKDSMAKVFMWDSGNTVGDISGNAKRVNAVSFKSSRPFRIATAGEDGQVNFYQGPPFKFDKTTKKHTQFVNCVRFSPDGSRFFSASSDKEVAIFDGKDGSLVIEKVVAKGSVYAAAWSPDNAQILTASGDKTAKILDAGTLEVVKETVQEVLLRDRRCEQRDDHALAAVARLLVDELAPDGCPQWSVGSQRRRRFQGSRPCC